MPEQQEEVEEEPFASPQLLAAASTGTAAAGNALYAATGPVGLLVGAGVAGAGAAGAAVLRKVAPDKAQKLGVAKRQPNRSGGASRLGGVLGARSRRSGAGGLLARTRRGQSRSGSPASTTRRKGAASAMSRRGNGQQHRNGSHGSGGVAKAGRRFLSGRRNSTRSATGNGRRTASNAAGGAKSAGAKRSRGSGRSASGKSSTGGSRGSRKNRAGRLFGGKSLSGGGRSRKSGGFGSKAKKLFSRGKRGGNSRRNRDWFGDHKKPAKQQPDPFTNWEKFDLPPRKKRTEKTDNGPPTKPLPTIKAPVKTEKGSTMPVPSEYKAAIEAIKGASSKEIKNARHMLDKLKHMPDLGSALADTLRKEATGIDAQIPIDPAIIDLIGSIASFQSAVSEQMTDINTMARMRHAQQIENIENPRPGAKMWDVGMNEK